MFTECLVCIVSDGGFVVAQRGTLDGNPDGVGELIWNFLRSQRNIEHLKEGLKLIYTPTDDELDHMVGEATKLAVEGGLRGVLEGNFADVYSYSSSPFVKRCPSLTDHCGGRILDVIAQVERPTNKSRVPIITELGFINSPDCSWAYVVDLDTNVFEVFSESQSKEETNCERFKLVGYPEDPVLRLLVTFDLFNLPINAKDFHEQILDGLDTLEEPN
ncbi:hypothetical protein FQN54_007157 [Arachnomyces sp. PD_36]|nr:hypothetical protein FQN54_007157 [Arachnomyces sp. PD_36]